MVKRKWKYFAIVAVCFCLMFGCIGCGNASEETAQTDAETQVAETIVEETQTQPEIVPEEIPTDGATDSSFTGRWPDFPKDRG